MDAALLELLSGNVLCSTKYLTFSHVEDKSVGGQAW